MVRGGAIAELSKALLNEGRMNENQKIPRCQITVSFGLGDLGSTPEDIH